MAVATLKELLEKIWRDEKCRQPNRIIRWEFHKSDNIAGRIEGVLDGKMGDDRFVCSYPGRLYR